MKKIKILIYLTSFSLICCTSYKINLAFKLTGVYDDNVKLSKVSNVEKEVIFIPMHHLGTKLFYDDVKAKIDSLKRIGYFFYTEEVKGNKKDSITVRKSIKISGIPFSRNNIGYKHFFDSIYKGKVKFKKEILDQPSSGKFGLDESNSKTVDVTLKEMIDYYESKYGEIKLEPCDFEKSFYEKPNCKYKPAGKKITDDVYVNFRNKNVIKTLLNDSHKKVAIIYGAKHFIGIREELLKHGFK
ncbi:hypothetical protein [Flavobacterium sangjuense]|uniref:TraB/GumN family protein n=1 Tax=Flavobacterium sangjuense TaxID=2518177 RepID=A0A4P7PQB0_9FLAO|nr:hypothetical protein [Flavobacterium sangjuense]QBZ96971.1 hypothetical protein GS03_00456 [Flavobacterium sangjuense]